MVSIEMYESTAGNLDASGGSPKSLDIDGRLIAGQWRHPESSPRSHLTPRSLTSIQSGAPVRLRCSPMQSQYEDRATPINCKIKAKWGYWRFSPGIMDVCRRFSPRLVSQTISASLAASQSTQGHSHCRNENSPTNRSPLIFSGVFDMLVWHAALQ